MPDTFADRFRGTFADRFRAAAKRHAEWERTGRGHVTLPVAVPKPRRAKRRQPSPPEPSVSDYVQSGLSALQSFERPGRTLVNLGWQLGQYAPTAYANVSDYFSRSSPADVLGDIWSGTKAYGRYIRDNPVSATLDFIPVVGDVKGFGEDIKRAAELRAAGDISGANLIEQIALPLAVAGLVPGVGEARTGGKLAVRAAREAADEASDLAVETGRRRAAAAERAAAARAAPQTPKYTRVQEGPFLRVQRENLVPPTVPEANQAGSIDALRSILQDPDLNIPAQVAEAYNRANFGRGYDLNMPEPGTGLMKQSGIARVFQEAVEGSPEYKSRLFERYGEMMPDVIEAARAQDYNQLLEAAYRQLAKETKSQFDVLPVRTSYHFGEGEYPVPSEMLRDVLGQGNLNVFRGGDPHPFLNDVDPDTGLTSNEMFRAVHDYFGHGTRGATFRPGGEETAYASHSQMMSPLARMALLSETRGQNSFVNYFPINADVISQQRQLKAVADSIRREARMRGEPIPYADIEPLNANLRELALKYEYAPQEPVLLPVEYLPPETEGGIPTYLQEIIRPRVATQPVRAVHFSQIENLPATDPTFYGTGVRGEDWRTRGRRGSPEFQTSFYIGPEGTVKPEPVVVAKNPYAYETSLSDLYDITSDPEGLIALANAYNLNETAIPDFTRMVREYGYTGYKAPFGPQEGANVFTPIQLERRIEQGPEGYAGGGLIQSHG